MTNPNRRYLTDADLEKIADLWRRYRSLKTLRDTALPPTAEGAWIHEAAEIHMGLIAEELEGLFLETYPWTPSEMGE